MKTDDVIVKKLKYYENKKYNVVLKNQGANIVHFPQHRSCGIMSCPCGIFYGGSVVYSVGYLCLPCGIIVPPLWYNSGSPVV